MLRDRLMVWAVPVVIALGVVVGLLAAAVPEASRAVSMFSVLAVGIVLWLWYRAKGGQEDRWLREGLVAAFAYRLAMALLHLTVGLVVFGGELDFRFFHDLGVERGWDILSGRWEGLLPFEWDWTIGTFFVSDLHGIFYLLVGSSLLGMFLMSGTLGFFSAYLFFRAFQLEFPGADREGRFVFAWLFFLPSMGYWTGLLGKDSWNVFFLALATFAVVGLTKRIRAGYLIGLVIGVLGATLVRPPVGVATAIAAGAALILVPGWTGRAAILRPIWFGGVAVIAVAGIGYVGGFVISLSPGLAMDVAKGNILEALAETAVLQNLALRGDLGVEIGSRVAGQVVEEGVEGVVRSLPLNMLTFLFRPIIFEVRQPLELLAAVEITALVFMMLGRWRSMVTVVRSLVKRPSVGFCALMVLLLTAGLSHESNFGIIVRHRTMVLPFLLWLLAVPVRRSGHAGPPIAEGGESPLVEAPVGA